MTIHGAIHQLDYQCVCVNKKNEMNEIKALKKIKCSSEAALFTLHALDHSLYSARRGLKHLVAISGFSLMCLM